MTSADAIAGLGILIMLAGLGLYGWSLIDGVRNGRRPTTRDARVRIGSFAVVMVGAGVFLSTRGGDIALTGSLTTFAMAVLIAFFAFNVRLD